MSYKVVTNESTNKAEYAYLYDEIEQYHHTESDGSVVKSQWQGKLNSVDVSDIISIRKTVEGINVNPQVWYVTSVPAAPENTDTTNMMSYISSNGWKLMTDKGNGIWEKPDTESGEVYAILTQISENGDSVNPEITNIYADSGYQGTFSANIYYNMTAPTATSQNLRKYAKNQCTAFYKLTNQSNGAYAHESDVTTILLLNNLRIKKVDYDNKGKGLIGAKFDIYTADNSNKLSYATINTIDTDAGTYTTEALKQIETNANGILDLSLAAGTYYIVESEAPRNYDLNSTMYEVEFTQDGKAKLLGTYKSCEQSAAELTYTDSANASNSAYYKKDNSADSDMASIDENNAIVTIYDKMNVTGKALFRKGDSTTSEPESITETEEITLNDSNRSKYSEGVVYDWQQNTSDKTWQRLRTEIIIDGDKATITRSAETFTYLPGAKYSLYVYQGADLSDDPAEVVQTDENVDGKYSFNTDSVPAGGRKTTVMATDDNGEIEISDLPIGMYILREVDSPTGYQISSDHEFSVTDSNISDEGDIDLTKEGQLSGIDKDVLWDSQIYSTIRLVKHDATSNAVVPNSTYSLFRITDTSETGITTVVNAMKNGNVSPETLGLVRVGTKKTESDGEIRFRSLQFGTYVILEDTPAAGYKVNYGWVRETNPPYNNNCVYTSDNDDSSWISYGIITINAESAEHNKGDGYFGISHTDERKKGTAKAGKYYTLDSGQKQYLPGAVFALFKKNGADPLPYYTNNSTDTTVKSYGTYYAVVDGETIYFSTIDDDNTVTSGKKSDGTDWSGNLTLDKKIGEKATNSSDNQTTNGWTDSFYELEWGNYYFKEITAPTGYEKDDDWIGEFKITRYNCDIGVNIEAENKQQKGSVKLTKFEKGIDTALSDITAVFELKAVSQTAGTADENIWAIYDSAENKYTSAITETAYNKLAANKKANYTKEFKTPASGKAEITKVMYHMS